MIHDKNWVSWKADSCKTYERGRFEDAGVKRKHRLEGSLASNPEYLGNDELTSLWKKGSNVQESIISKKTRYT